MIKSFVLGSFLNNTKRDKIYSIIKEYRILANKISLAQWRSFYEMKRLDKNTDIKTIDTGLSARYKQTCQYQVVGMLDSFISNRQNDFRDMVSSSSLEDERRKALYQINRRKLWFKTQAISSRRSSLSPINNAASIEYPSKTIHEAYQYGSRFQGR